MIRILYLFIIISISVKAQTLKEIEDFKYNNTNKFISNGTGKSDGLKFSIRYPKAYIDVDGERPHIVRKFKDPNNNGCYYSITVAKLNITPTSSDKAFALSKSSLIQQTGEKVDEVLSYTNNLKIDGEMAAFLEWSVSRKVNYGNQNIILTVLSRGYLILYENYVIRIDFAVGSAQESKEQIRKRFENYKLLFTQVVNSFVLLSKWNIK